MKIGIDISQIVHEGTGVSRFTEGLTNAILDYDNKNKWTFLFYSLRKNFDENLEEKIRLKGHKLIKWKLPPTFVSLLWNDFHDLSKRFMLHATSFMSLNWFISSDWIEPPLNKVKKATIIHDLVYLRYPETVDKKIFETQKKRLKWVKKESNLIFVDSKSTKDDVIKLLKIDSKKIVVNYPGVEIAKPTKKQITETLKKFNLKKPFILTVGKLEPRKNIERLIEAIKQLNNESIDLVIVGPEGWDNNNQLSAISHQQQNIKFLGYINDFDLYSLYSSCLFFIYPSIYEGFGYPIVETMKLGIPVATSNTSSLKQIGQNTALLFDPMDISSIKNAIQKLLSDSKLRTELAKKGKEKSKMFTWENYYQIMIDTFRRF